MDAPRKHRLPDLNGTRIRWLPSLLRFLVRWSKWVTRDRSRPARAVLATDQSPHVHSPGYADPPSTVLPQEPLPTRNDAEIDRCGDPQVLLGHGLLEANRTDAPPPETSRAPGIGPEASPRPSCTDSADVSPSEQGSGEGSQGDQFAPALAEKAATESDKPAPSTADDKAVPETATDYAAPDMPRASVANPHELERAAAAVAAETRGAETPQSRAETGADETEAFATDTVTEFGSPPTEALTRAERDNAPTIDDPDDAPHDSPSDLIDPEVSRLEVTVQLPSESDLEPQAGASDAVSKYRPRLRPRTAPPSRPAAVWKEQEQTAATLEAILLLTFLPGNWGVSVSMLLTRADEVPESLEVRVGGTKYSLFAIDDRLFEPVQPPPDVDLVSSGFAAETVTLPARRWVRTTRDLHVFSQRPGVSGFASVPRALIGQENVVLCRSHLVGTAKDCARATGSGELEQVAGPGIPAGWQCFRAYHPRAPADFGDASDIFLSLNPLPDAAIELSGGIASARGTWIVGSPPTIRILGTDPSSAEFTIDSHPASPTHSDGWLAPGWDAPGTHTIRFGGLSRTYEIVEVNEAWPTWAAADASAFSACGAKVSAQLPAFAFPGEPCWLLGACAGDVAFAVRSSAGIAIAAPPFQPIWALTVRRGGRLLPATALPYRARPQMPRESVAREQILQWCNLLRGSSAPTEAGDKELWRQYRQLARRLRRRGR